MTALETALQYAGRGWRVIPCRSDKISRIRNWQVAASCDPETIITWWTQWPNAWIALLCGCGFVVIDVDTGEAHNNVDGFATLAQLGPLPKTRRVRTPTGGMHIYLQSDQPVRSRVIGPGLELRAANQYVIAPPSPGYVVIYDVPLARLPDWLFDGPSRAVKVEKKQPGGPLVATAEFPKPPAELPKPLYLKVHRLVPLSAVVTRHHQRRVIGILNIALQRQDHRNDGLNIAGFCMRELIRNGIISSPAAEELLIEVAILNGYAAKDGFIAAEKTIRSGLGLAP
jgi:Bifunctional DNA primase/polymerase, N-terminal